MTKVGEYFTEADWGSEWLPPITWQAMLESGSIIVPTTLIRVLADARNFLVREPGPNLSTRKADAPAWFNFWEDLMLSQSIVMEDTPEVSQMHSYGWTSGLKPFNDVAQYVKSKGRTSGVNLMGEGAGRPGHIWTYHWMREKLGRESTVVWAFEQPEYFAYKERPAPFLPLTVRLCMAIYLGVDVATVLPLPPEGASGDEMNRHYLKVFRQLGVEYHFADAYDPHAIEKAGRGKTDIDTIVPHLDFPSTRDGVRKLLDSGGLGKVWRSSRKSEPIFSGTGDRSDVLSRLLGEITIASGSSAQHAIFGEGMSMV